MKRWICRCAARSWTLTRSVFNQLAVARKIMETIESQWPWKNLVSLFVPTKWLKTVWLKSTRASRIDKRTDEKSHSTIKKKTLYNSSLITIFIALLASVKIATLFIRIHRLFRWLSLLYFLTQLCLTMLKTVPNLVWQDDKIVHVLRLFLVRWSCAIFLRVLQRRERIFLACLTLYRFNSTFVLVLGVDENSRNSDLNGRSGGTRSKFRLRGNVAATMPAMLETTTLRYKWSKRKQWVRQADENHADGASE